MKAFLRMLFDRRKWIVIQRSKSGGVWHRAGDDEGESRIEAIRQKYAESDPGFRYEAVEAGFFKEFRGPWIDMPEYVFDWLEPEQPHNQAIPRIHPKKKA